MTELVAALVALLGLVILDVGAEARALHANTPATASPPPRLPANSRPKSRPRGGLLVAVALTSTLPRSRPRPSSP